VRLVVLPWKEVPYALIVWPGNLKIPQARTKRCVPVVHRAITRMHQTCQRANSAHVGMRNRHLSKQHVLNAVQVNLTVLQVLVVANCVSIQRILVKKEETPVASSVQWVGRLKTAV